MFWDIVLPVLAAIGQVLTGFLGWRVTVDGVRPERKKMYEWLFAVASIIGIAAVGIAAYRGASASGQLETVTKKLDEIEKGQHVTNSGIQQIRETPPVVNVQPPRVTVNSPSVPQHTRVDFIQPVFPSISPLPLHVGQTPAVNLAFANNGDFAVLEARLGGTLQLANKADERKVFKTYRRGIKLSPPSGTINPRSGVLQFGTFVASFVLTEDDVSKLSTGDRFLCVIGVAQWKDSTGHYETDLCQCLTGESLSKDFNWHVLPENNTEHKLSP